MPDNKTIAEKAARDVLLQAAELLGVPMRELKDHITPEGLQSLLQQSAIRALSMAKASAMLQASNTNHSNGSDIISTARHLRQDVDSRTIKNIKGER